MEQEASEAILTPIIPSAVGANLDRQLYRGPEPTEVKIRLETQRQA